MTKKIYVYDLETYPNFFLFSFRDITTGQIIHFEISDRLNEFYALKTFLHKKDIKYLVGFNNLAFDYPVMHKTILTQSVCLDLDVMYAIVQSIIKEKYSNIKPREVMIPQIDLFKIWHYDNKNKSTSLKWLEYALRMKNIEDLPFPVGTHLTSREMRTTIKYCENDLEATHQFLNKSIKHIAIRKAYSKLERLDLMNSSEIHITKQIMLKKLSAASMIDKWELNKQRTIRREVKISDVIFPYIKFNQPENRRILQEFQSRVWHYDTDQEKALSSIAFSAEYKNVTREYAEGGLHSFGEPGIYESDDEYVLYDVDFASFYPFITFMNALHPEHIDEETFNKVYRGFYEERKKYPKTDPRNYIMKIVLNGTYGLSKDKYSFLYDPKWQLAVTVNGQLLLTKLTEMIFEKCLRPVKIIFENTDGAMYRIHRKDIPELKMACAEMEALCKIPLEIQECKKIIARDVNNYINIISDDNIKFKGAFEIDRDYHKNHSKRAVAIALANYYIHGCSVSDTIKTHLDGTSYDFAENHGVFDFCHGAKMKGGNKLYAVTHDAFAPGGKIEVPLSKVTRYYVSNEGVELVKKLPPTESGYLTDTDKHKIKINKNQMNIFDLIEDVLVDPEDREGNIEAGYKSTVMNEFVIKEDYDINYDYYINECNKIIEKCGTNSMAMT